MRIIGIPLSPPKGRWPKDEHKRALRRAQLEKAGKARGGRKREAERRRDSFQTFIKRQQKQRSKYRRGSHGAASEVRHIDPAEYQPSAPVSAPTHGPARNETITLLDAADKILVADAKRRHGKRHAQRVQNMIVTGHYVPSK